MYMYMDMVRLFAQPAAAINSRYEMRNAQSSGDYATIDKTRAESMENQALAGDIATLGLCSFMNGAINEPVKSDCHCV